MQAGVPKHRVGAMELLGVIGFSLTLGWFFITYFWLFVSEPTQLSKFQAFLCLTLLFTGLPVGNLLIRVLAVRLKRHLQYRGVLFLATAIALILPILVSVFGSGFAINEYLYYIASFLSGMSTAWFIASWLDVCGRTRIRNILIFTTASYAVGALLFLLCTMIPGTARAVAASIFLLVSIALLLYMGSSSNAPELPNVRPRSDFLTSPREVEPTFIAFGIVFGIGFMLLFSLGQNAIILAIAVVFVAATAMMVCAILNLKISIVLLVRILSVAAVGVFLFLSVAPEWLWFAGGCVFAGIWVIFTTANAANLVKLVLDKRLPVFYHVPSGLIPFLTGFAGGWLIAFGVLQNDSGSQLVPYVLLSAVFLVVLTNMIFYPDKKHHDIEQRASDFIVKSPADTAKDDVLQIKCDAIAKLYQLSPREADILVYLVRGRNAEYIRTKLVISAHTVKSHIYNIYQKTNIHSQQKLMDLVEEFSFENDNS